MCFHTKLFIKKTKKGDGNVVLDSFNMHFRDEDNILDNIYK